MSRNIQTAYGPTATNPAFIMYQPVELREVEIPIDPALYAIGFHQGQPWQQLAAPIPPQDPLGPFVPSPSSSANGLYDRTGGQEPAPAPAQKRRVRPRKNANLESDVKKLPASKEASKTKSRRKALIEENAEEALAVASSSSFPSATTTKPAPKEKKGKKAIKQAVEDPDEEESVPIDTFASRISALEKRGREWVESLAIQPTLALRSGDSVTISSRFTSDLVAHGVFFKNPSPDTSIPTSPAQCETILHNIVKAMKNNVGTRESNATPQFQKRWGNAATHFSSADFNLAAANVLDTLLNIHTTGWTTPIYEPDLRAKIFRTKFYAFADRLELVLRLLTVSKNSCSDIMKGERLVSILGNPAALIARTETNAKSNANKAQDIRVGNSIRMMKRTREEYEAGAGVPELAYKKAKKGMEGGNAEKKHDENKENDKFNGKTNAKEDLILDSENLFSSSSSSSSSETTLVDFPLNLTDIGDSTGFIELE